VVALVAAAACSDSADRDPVTGDSETEPAGTAAAPADAGTDPAEPGAARPGGEIVLAVEQWPECLNPLTSCANAAWVRWSAHVHLLPRLMELDPGNNIGASPVLAETPTTDNGGAVLNDDGTLTVTYRLDPEARWSDGTPMTSTDVWFTWRATLDTEGSLNTIGYDLITAVGHDDPHTAVIALHRATAPAMMSTRRPRSAMRAMGMPRVA